MLQTIDTHTVNVSRLTPNGWALDVGCRGFGFARAMRDMGLVVIALDPDPGVEAIEDNERIYLHNTALVGKAWENHHWYAMFGDGCANHLCASRDDVPGYAKAVRVPCKTLPGLMNELRIRDFSVVKLDCEGAEYAILESLREPVADQITVEFHDFLGAGFNPCFPDCEAYYRRLMASRFGEMYRLVQHERTPLNGNGPMNYWDSLFIRKD